VATRPLALAPPEGDQVMATFTLTPAANNFNGTAAADLFRGFGGGNDVLRGNAGNDRFIIQTGQRGLLDGGVGTDRIDMSGHNNHTFDLNLRIINVENLYAFASINHFGTAAQYNSFTRINPMAPNSDEFNIFLQGPGGRLDLTTKYVSTKHLTVDAENATSAVTVTGSARGDELIGSDFNDRLFGGAGNDTVRGGLGGNDILAGGVGRDFLEGDSGRDSFFFNVAAATSNIDHIGDFRPVDDTIRLENAIFTALATGPLSPAFFKDIGVAARDGNDRVLYNSDNGRLFYDGDALGPSAPRLIAILDNFAGDIPTLTAADILVV
jgi:Ca2+-binding RTX toxin-like protein